MPIHLYTGLPGAGKSLAVVHRMLQLSKEEPGRPIYVHGVDGLKPGIAEPLEDVSKWKDLPHGSIIVIDEVQEHMPVDRGNTPEWIKELSRHRHYGMDFIVATQHPSLISTYLRRLVSKHTHHIRKFGTQIVDRYSWDKCQDSPEAGRAMKAAVKALWTFPKECFDLYESATMHTVKKHIPLKVYLFVLSVLVAVAAIVSLPFVFGRMKGQVSEVHPGQSSSADGAVPKPQGSEVQRQDDDLRQRDFAKWIRPRIDGVPWSAPAFDGLAVKTVPKLFCVAVEDGRCTCHSEQGTRVEVQAKLCRQIVSDGLYNPFAEPLDTGSRGGGAPQPQPSSSLPASAAETAAATPDSGGPGKDRATAKVYTPPEYHTEWNPDPWGGQKRH